MLRYYAIATVIVLAIAVIATAWYNRDFLRIRLASSKHSMPPQHLRISTGEAGALDSGVTGDAPWALSALPDCFVQRSETRGDPAYVRARIPAGAQPVPAGTHLSYGPCTIVVRSGDLLVDRGSDRLRVPPRATLYRVDDSLALFRVDGGTAVLRTYDVTSDHR